MTLYFDAQIIYIVEDFLEQHILVPTNSWVQVCVCVCGYACACVCVCVCGLVLVCMMCVSDHTLSCELYMKRSPSCPKIL